MTRTLEVNTAPSSSLALPPSGKKKRKKKKSRNNNNSSSNNNNNNINNNNTNNNNGVMEEKEYPPLPCVSDSEEDNEDSEDAMPPLEAVGQPLRRSMAICTPSSESSSSRAKNRPIRHRRPSTPNNNNNSNNNNNNKDDEEDARVPSFTVTGTTLTPDGDTNLRGSHSCTDRVMDRPFVLPDRNALKKILNLDDDHLDDDEHQDNDDDDDDDDDDNVVGFCLHCSLPPPPRSSNSKCIPVSSSSSSSVPTATGIQVSCDDCRSFICDACHWCHEFQANHEIRVCDRCDAFYCRSCDEMDQCEDCSEVVCGGCSTLMSCKFCGCGLCEDCATACGRCGIVLCARDAKFAVECDTCKMSYCLVCLASGTKEPCVRCGHRPSKRVEKLVHLRLKSIYKAFKQSGASLGSNTSSDTTANQSDKPVRPNSNARNNRSRTYSPPPPTSNASARANSASGSNNVANGHSTTAATLARAATITAIGKGSSDPPAFSDRSSSSASATGMPFSGDVGAVLQAAAAAAAATTSNTSSRAHDTSHGGSNNSSSSGRLSQRNLRSFREAFTSDHTNNNKNRLGSDDSGRNASSLESNSRNCEDRAFYDGGGRVTSSSSSSSPPPSMHKNKKVGSDRFASRTQAEADAAAAALLAELDEERLLSEASNKAKKSKKKRRKERQQAAAAAKKEEQEKQQTHQNDHTTFTHEIDKAVESHHGDHQNQPIRESIDPKTSSIHDKADSDGEAGASGDKMLSSVPTPNHGSANEEDKNNTENETNLTQPDEIERKLANLVSDSDVQGIEELLSTLKGVPGRAALRKNAKKALKRIREELVVAPPSESIVNTIPVSNVPNETEPVSMLVSNPKDTDKVKHASTSPSVITTQDFEPVKAQKISKQVDEDNNDAFQTVRKSSDGAAKSSNTKPREGAATSSPPPKRTAIPSSVGSVAPTNEYKPPEPLLKLISHTHRQLPGQTSSRAATNGNNPSEDRSGMYHAPSSARTECVMHMAPSVVGWVIGKGGQRIRDLMDESGAKVWIDQDSMGPRELRIVYVSGTRRAVDTAVRMIKELVAKAPVGGTTASASVASVPTPLSGSQRVGGSSISLVPSQTQHAPLPELGMPVSASFGLRRPPNQVHIVPSSGSPDPTSGGDLTVPQSAAVSTPAPQKPALSATSVASYSAAAAAGVAPTPSSASQPSRGPAPSTSNVAMTPMGLPQSLAPGALSQVSSESGHYPSVHELTCEPRFVPLLIGRRGWTVKHIQDASGARVDIDQTVNPRRIVVSGEINQVKNAVRMVRDVLNYPHAQLNQNTGGGGGGGNEHMHSHPAPGANGAYHVFQPHRGDASSYHDFSMSMDAGTFDPVNRREAAFTRTFPRATIDFIHPENERNTFSGAPTAHQINVEEHQPDQRIESHANAGPNEVSYLGVGGNSDVPIRFVPPVIPQSMEQTLQQPNIFTSIGDGDHDRLQRPFQDETFHVPEQHRNAVRYDDLPSSMGVNMQTIDPTFHRVDGENSRYGRNPTMSHENFLIQPLIGNRPLFSGGGGGGGGDMKPRDVPLDRTNNFVQPHDQFDEYHGHNFFTGQPAMIQPQMTDMPKQSSSHVPRIGSHLPNLYYSDSTGGNDTMRKKNFSDDVTRAQEQNRSFIESGDIPTKGTPVAISDEITALESTQQQPSLSLPSGMSLPSPSMFSYLDEEESEGGKDVGKHVGSSERDIIHDMFGGNEDAKSGGLLPDFSSIAIRDDHGDGTTPSWSSSFPTWVGRTDGLSSPTKTESHRTVGLGGVILNMDSSSGLDASSSLHSLQADGGEPSTQRQKQQQSDCEKNG